MKRAPSCEPSSTAAMPSTVGSNGKLPLSDVARKPGYRRERDDQCSCRRGLLRRVPQRQQNGADQKASADAQQSADEADRATAADADRQPRGRALPTRASGPASGTPSAPSAPPRQRRPRQRTPADSPSAPWAGQTPQRCTNRRGDAHGGAAPPVDQALPGVDRQSQEACSTRSATDRAGWRRFSGRIPSSEGWVRRPCRHPARAWRTETMQPQSPLQPAHTSSVLLSRTMKAALRRPTVQDEGQSLAAA